MSKVISVGVYTTVALQQLIQCAQKSDINLPQKSLLWEDKQGITHLSYNAPWYVAQRHNIHNCTTIINKVPAILNKLAIAATSKQ